MNRAKSIHFWHIIAALLLLATTFGNSVFAQEKKSKAPEKKSKVPHAELHISGYGLFGNPDLKRTLKSLDLKWKEREFFDANFIEDAALIILARLRRDGFLAPKIRVEMTLADGRKMTVLWPGKIEPPLPRSIRVREVKFKIQRGVLYRYQNVEVRGLKDISEKEARGFFVERGVLLPLKRTRIYTPDRLERSMGNLTEVLARHGYENAQVNVASLSVNDKTGAVNLEVEVKPGKKSIVELIRVETREHTNTPPVNVQTIQTNVPFSKIWQQDFAQQLRATNYHQGYPDARVEVEPAKRDPAEAIVEMELLANVNRGERIVLRDVKFEGLKHTKKSVVERRVELKEGDWLDRIEAEQGRYRLARLGIFDAVNLRYDRVDEHTRDVIYSVQEGKRLNIYLLAGYGSYELVRGGIELEQHNVFGLAHHARLRAVQSLKATSADYRYTMPEFFGESVDAFLRGFYLQREEVDFTREEYGGGAGARTFVDQIQSEISARYDYQVLSAFETDVTEGPTNALVGSVTFELTHDRRDSPLYPRRGYKVSGTFETASEYLGGEVNFWRFETQNSFHQPLDAGRWLHFGLSHGFAIPLGEARRDLPFNRRFFPGGDNSVRGYQYGEAGPRNAFGKIIGAETYTIGNIEFEQALTDKISLVSFIDALGFGRRLEDYPFDDYRISIGGGLRWKTIIGPVRLEYGYNVIQRRFDPTGTIHFSIGAPF